VVYFSKPNGVCEQKSFVSAALDCYIHNVLTSRDHRYFQCLYAAVFCLMQIAAKINPTGTSESTGQKRPLEDGSGMDWIIKCFHRPSLRTADSSYIKLTCLEIPQNISVMH
jgi:hypothetical protein